MACLTKMASKPTSLEQTETPVHILGGILQKGKMESCAEKRTGINLTPSQPSAVKNSVPNRLAAISVNAMDAAIGSDEQARVTELAIANF